MSTRFLMWTSVICGGATLAALVLLYIHRRFRYPALMAFLATTLLYRAAALAYGLSPREATIREGVYALLGALVALDAWGRMANHVKSDAMHGALIAVLAIGAVGAFAMLIPGPHPDYRGLIPVSLAAAATLVCAMFGTDDKLDAIACWGLTLTFFAQAFHYLGFEFGLEWATLTAWVRTGSYLWASLEIAVATRR